MRPSMKNIRALRCRVAEVVYDMYISYGSIHGVEARDIVQQSQMTLAAYLEDVRTNQWASILELLVASELLHVDIAIDTMNAKVTVGKPTYVIKLRDHHFYLYRLHQPYTLCSGMHGVQRGGMRNGYWTWEDNEDLPMWAIPPPEHADSQPIHPSSSPSQDAIPPLPVALLGTHYPQDTLRPTTMQPSCPMPSCPTEAPQQRLPTPRTPEQSLSGIPEQLMSVKGATMFVDVVVAEKMKADITKAVVRLEQECTVYYARKKLARILGLHEERMTLYDRENMKVTLALGAPVPSYIYVDDAYAQALPDGCVITVKINGTSGVLATTLHSNWTHRQVLDHLATMVAIPQDDLDLRNMDGEPWIYPASALETTTILALKSQVSRGGTRNGLSPTMPFPDDEQHHDNEEHDEIDDGANLVDDHHEEERDLAHELDMDRWLREDIRDENDPPVHDVRDQDDLPVRGDRSRSTSRRRIQGRTTRSPNPLHGEDRGNSTYWSGIWATTPPAAQPERIKKSVLVESRRIGWIAAAPGACVTQVVADFVDKVKPHSLIDVYPFSALRWKDVIHVKLWEPEPPKVDRYMDMRHGRWERLQEIRHVPALRDGLLLDTLLFPWHLSIQEAQQRLDLEVEEVDLRQQWQIVAINIGEWVVSKMRLPPMIQEDLEDLRYLREQAVLRGGMPKCPKCDGNYFAIEIKQMHDKKVWKQPFPLHWTVGDLNDFLAAYYQVPKDMVMYMVDGYIPDMMVKLIRLVHSQLEVYVTTKDTTIMVNAYLDTQNIPEVCAWQHREDLTADPPVDIPYMFDQQALCDNLICPFLGDKRLIKSKVNHNPNVILVIEAEESVTASDVVQELAQYYDTDTASILLLCDGILVEGNVCANDLCMSPLVVSVPNTALRMRSTSTEHEQLPTPEGPPVPLVPVRGGARSMRREDPEQMQRQAMLTWATQRIREACPRLDDRIIKVILRAEARTVTAVLNARSTMQVVHVTVAALRRAGLVQHAQELENLMQRSQPEHNQGGEGQQQVQEHDQSDPVGTRDRVAQGDHEQQQQQQPHTQQEQPTTFPYDANSVYYAYLETYRAIQQMSVLLQHQYVAAMRYDPTPLAQRVHHLDTAMEQQFQVLSQVVSSLQDRLGRWETEYLPAMFDRMQEIHPLPASPPVTPPRHARPELTAASSQPYTPTTHGADHDEQHETSEQPAQENASDQQALQQLPSDDDQPVSSVLDRLRERSINSRTRAEQEESGRRRTALLPFRH